MFSRYNTRLSSNSLYHHSNYSCVMQPMWYDTIPFEFGLRVPKNRPTVHSDSEYKFSIPSKGVELRLSNIVLSLSRHLSPESLASDRARDLSLLSLALAEYLALIRLYWPVLSKSYTFIYLHQISLSRIAFHPCHVPDYQPYRPSIVLHIFSVLSHPRCTFILIASPGRVRVHHNVIYYFTFSTSDEDYFIIFAPTRCDTKFTLRVIFPRLPFLTQRTCTYRHGPTVQYTTSQPGTVGLNHQREK